MLKRLNCESQALLPLLGGRFCPMGRMVGFGLLERGIEIDPTTFGQDQLDELISSGQMIGFLEFWTAENSNSEAQMATATSGEESERISGIKGWSFVFDKGIVFQNELNKLKNSDRYAPFPILEDGSGVFHVKSNGKLTGFDAKLFVGIYDIPLTADVTGANLRIQLTRSATDNYQSSSDVFVADEFKFTEIKPIEGLKIELDPIVAGATTLTATVTSLGAGSAIVGLTEIPNWKVKKDGVLSVPTALTYNGTTKKYTWTTAATTAGQEISVLTSADGNPVYPKDSSYFSGESQTLTVV